MMSVFTDEFVPAAARLPRTAWVVRPRMGGTELSHREWCARTNLRSSSKWGGVPRRLLRLRFYSVMGDTLPTG